MSEPRPKQVDAPEKDPNVREVGFDVTAFTPAEMAEQGIRIVPRLVVGDKSAPAWRSHSEHAGQDPATDAVERSYARLAARRHLESHKTLKGLRLQRTFPCLGTFRHSEFNGAVQMVICDTCGAELGVRHHEGTDD